MKIRHLLPSLVLSVLAPGSELAANDTKTIPLQELYEMPISEVPEKVRVTELKSRHGRQRVDTLIHVLEKFPNQWEYIGGGKISVSNQYSNAGLKSIRWDWQSGDIIRIRNLGVLTDIRILGDSEIAPFVMFLFQEKPLPKNTKFDLFFRRVDYTEPGKDEERKTDLINLHYYMNFSGSWCRMGGSRLKFREESYSNLNRIDIMPDGVPEPEDNELILRAPTDVDSGTFFLDRIVVSAQLPNKGLLETESHGYLPYTYSDKSGAYDQEIQAILPLEQMADTVTNGIPDTPFSPEKYNMNRANYYGYYLQQPQLPERISGEQKVLLDNLRTEFFEHSVPDSLPKTDPKYISIEKQALEALARDCILQKDGSYKFKESINYCASNPFLMGDRGVPITPAKNFPESSGHEINVNKMLSVYADWFVRCPDSQPVQAFVKAYIDWFGYQYYNPPMWAVGYTSPKSGYGGVISCRNLIAGFRRAGAEGNQHYIDTLGRWGLWMANAHMTAYAKEKLPGISREFSGKKMYSAPLFETDDRKLISMLNSLQDTFTRIFDISVIDRRGMIKPDYTFYHHGHVSYWGNYHAHMEAAMGPAGTPFDFKAETLRNLALYTTRYTFMGQETSTMLKGGQSPFFGFPTYQQRWNVKFKGDAYDPKLTYNRPFSLDGWPSNSVFDYFYQMDWEKVPSAKKYLAGVLGRAEVMSEESKKTLLTDYPKLGEIKSQPTSHFSINWTGGGTYNHGLAKVAYGGYNDKDPNPSRPSPTASMGWLRGYGALYLMEVTKTRPKPLGGTHEGYEWTKNPGTTVPNLTNADYLKICEAHQVSKGGRGNGSLTFNETDEEFGKYGNFAFQSRIDENLPMWKDLLDIDGVQGNKSYHFFQDTVVCLGSSYQAGTDRSMETTLFQEGLGNGKFGMIWDMKNVNRWNPENPSFVHNGKEYTEPVKLENPLKESNYLISPFGHAWMIPGGQSGKLKIDWSHRKTLYRYRWGFDVEGKQDASNQHDMEGTTVIASLDHGPARKESAHHYCVVLNSEGRDMNTFKEYVEQRQANPGYRVIKQDEHSHAIVFNENGKALFSYLVFSPEQELDIPLVSSANTRVNLMMQPGENNEYTLSICDPCVDIEKDRNAENFERSKEREVRISFSKDLKVELLSSTSGLPQVNPPLEAHIESDNQLVFTTSNGVTDNFIVKIQ